MRSVRLSTLCTAVILGLACGLAEAQTPLGTAFTYQGQLKDGGSPANGTYDLTFALHDQLAGGTQQGSTVCLDNIAISEGLFTLKLDFGAWFTGDQRFLEIAVRADTGLDCGNVTGFVTLSSRQVLTAAPYALALPGLYTQPNATSPNVIGGHSVNSVAAGVVGATIGGGGLSGYSNLVTDDYGTVSGGYGNAASGLYGTVGGGGANTASGYGSTVAGGEANTASRSHSTVSGGYANAASGLHGTVGGGYDNEASGYDSTVAGGAHNAASGQGSTAAGGRTNAAGGYGSTVAGGEANTASGDSSAVGGGYDNEASGYESTVGGGRSNAAGGYYSTVGGGRSNAASGQGSTVAGGEANTASGMYGTVGGGWYNQAGGTFSFAAGHQARVRDATQSGDSDGDEGTFVWADDTLANFQSTGPNQFLIRASGGVGIGTTTPDTTLHVGTGADASLASGSGYQVLGPTAGANLVLDNDEIMARNNAATASLYLNRDGGNVVVGNSTGYATFHVEGVGGTDAFRVRVGNNTKVLTTDNGGTSFGSSTAAPANGVRVAGDCNVIGTLTKGGGSFKIDHPLDPENYYLYHSFVESPDMKNIYDGIVTTDANGYATVVLPDWFEALNRDFRYQLTVLDESEDTFVLAKVYRKITKNQFVIKTSAPGIEVSWQVTGIRKDAWAEQNRIPVEAPKEPENRGRYLHPETFRLLPDSSVDAAFEPDAAVPQAGSVRP